MKKTMRVGKAVLLMLCMCMLGLTACGEKTGESTAESTEPAATSISLKKDGSISDRIVEDFGESYYDENGLKSMIETSIAEYKAENASAQITLKSCKVSDGIANVLMEYGDYKAYAGYNGEDFFVGTIQGANMEGFDLNVTLNSVSDKNEKTSISKPELLGMGENHIVILEAPDYGETQEPETIRVECFDEILYVGEGVTAVGKKSADVKLSNGYGMIVFK